MSIINSTTYHIFYNKILKVYFTTLAYITTNNRMLLLKLLLCYDYDITWNGNAHEKDPFSYFSYLFIRVVTIYVEISA